MTTDSGQLDLNHWLLRLVALIIDTVIIAIPVGILYAILSLFVFLSDPFFMVWGTWLLLPLIFGILWVLYYTILDVAWSATIGKRALGLQVQTVNSGKVPFEKAFIRNISKIHPLLLLLDWILAVITPGDDKRQKFSDRIAGTTVISIRQPFESSTGFPPPPPPNQ
jgi:uncharacterized RDD family membrane protein YckC